MSKISDAEIEEVLARRRDAIIAEIYNCFFSADDPALVSIIDIFNALMLLVQTSIMFVLVSFDSKNQTISDDPKEYINFNQHPFHQQKIEESVQQAKKDNAFFEIFGVDDKRLIVLKASDGASHSKKYGFKILKPREKIDEDVYSYQLAKILDKDIYLTRFGQGFLEILQKIVSDCKEFSMETPYNKLSEENKDEYKILFKEFKTSLETGYKLLGIKYDGVINQAYKKSKNSLNFIPDINNKERSSLSLPNFLLFIRDYSCINKEPRHYYYNYDLYILICEEQEIAIIEYLKNLNSHKNDYFNSYEKKLENTESYYQNILKDIHRDFWNKLEEDDDIGSILLALKSPFKKGSYSMSDPCFMSSLIEFRDLRVNGGIHRSLHEYGENPPNYSELNEEKKQELLRIVAVYYLFLGMARYIKEDTLEDIEKDVYPSVMLCPATIGGKVFGVMSYVTFKQEDKAQSIMEYSAAWRQNYHIFSAGHRRFKRNVRNYIWRSYVIFTSHVFCEQVKKIEQNNNYDIKIFRSNLNRNLQYLTRFFSFSEVNASFTLVKKDLGIFGDIDIDLSISKNNFFSSPYGLRTPERFTNISEITYRIKDEFLLRRY